MSADTKTEQAQVAKCPLHGISKVQIDFISGTCAGILATFVAHPLDTVKVRFQIAKASDNMTLSKTLSDIYRYEGVSQLIVFNQRYSD